MCYVFTKILNFVFNCKKIDNKLSRITMFIGEIIIYSSVVRKIVVKVVAIFCVLLNVDKCTGGFGVQCWMLDKRQKTKDEGV